MNWAEEPYVRIYRRNTPEMTAWGWQTRAAFWELLREADEDGEIVCRSSAHLAMHVGIPPDVLAAAIEVLAEPGYGPLVKTDRGFRVRNYVVAQNTPRADAARKREQRKRATRQKDYAMSHEVTDGHTASQNVTPSLALPGSSSALPLPGSPLGSTPAPSAPASPSKTKKATKAKRDPDAPVKRHPDLEALLAHHVAVGGGMPSRADEATLARMFMSEKHRGLEVLRGAVTNASAQHARFAPTRSLAYILRHIDQFAGAAKPFVPAEEALRRRVMAEYEAEQAAAQQLLLATEVTRDE